VIVLTIDEEGMAKTRERKLEVAKRIYDIAVNEHGLRPEDLVYVNSPLHWRQEMQVRQFGNRDY
jgi:cobalamin-dependent methionine synthase I